MIGWIDDKDCLVSALSSTKENRKQSKGMGRGALLCREVRKDCS